MLRQGWREEGAMDARGGPHARLLHPGARPRELARRPDQHRYVIHPYMLDLPLCSCVFHGGIGVPRQPYPVN